MTTPCFGCKTLPELHYGEPVPPCMEPIVFARGARGKDGPRSAYECVCCGKQWVETVPSPQMVPRFVLAISAAPALAAPVLEPHEAEPLVIATPGGAAQVEPSPSVPVLH